MAVALPTDELRVAVALLTDELRVAVALLADELRVAVEAGRVACAEPAARVAVLADAERDTELTDD